MTTEDRAWVDFLKGELHWIDENIQFYSEEELFNILTVRRQRFERWVGNTRQFVVIEPKECLTCRQ